MPQQQQKQGVVGVVHPQVQQLVQNDFNLAQGAINYENNENIGVNNQFPTEYGQFDEATLAADIDFEGVRRNHQPLHDETGCSVADEAVTLHLTHAEATIAGSTFGWLPRQHCDPAARPGMHLVLHHMLEALVEDRAGEDVAGEHLARDARHE